MASINKVILVGNLGKDPETRTFPNGGQICSVSIATTDRWNDKQSGEMREATEWHRVTFNNRLAEVAAQYLRKGSQVYVEGSLHTRKWSDKDGVEKYATEVRADQMQMLGGRPGGDQDGRETPGGGEREARAGGGGQERATAPVSPPAPRAAAPASRKGPAAATTGASTGFDDMDDDVPFVTASPRCDMQPSKVRRLQRTDF